MNSRRYDVVMTCAGFPTPNHFKVLLLAHCQVHIIQIVCNERVKMAESADIVFIIVSLTIIKL